MKKIKYIVFIIFAFLMCSTNVLANTLNSIDIDAQLDENGNLFVTEVWDMKTNKDTEIYKQEYNLGNITISDFKVKDENIEYEINPVWNIHDSFNNKKYQFGINNVAQGVELCWGISEYGDKTYTISYTKNNAVFNTEDAQVLYLRMINDLDFPPKRFSISISGPNEFEDTLDVWGYGYKGYAYVQGGKIFMSNEENTPLGSSDYAVLLVKFPLNTFNVSIENSYSQYPTFDSVYNEAENGTFDYDYNYDEEVEQISTVLNILLSLAPYIMFGGIAFAIIKNSNKYKFGTLGKKIDMKTINAFRAIPCKKDIFRAYFIAQAYSLNKNKTDFFGTLFLKWLNEDKLIMMKREVKRLFGTKEVTSIDLSNFKQTGIEVEDKVYEMMLSASKDGILDEDEFEKYAKNHYSKVLSWFDDAEKYGRDLFTEESLVTKSKGKYIIDDKVKKDAIELAGLKKYLMEFASMNTKEPMEVKLWKEYLMFAQIFGIADKVAKQFEKLYPEVLVEMRNSHMDIGDIILINSFSNTAVVSASSARSAAQSYSSGGGGFSSGGGGGGSFGGGGGGSR